MMAEAKKTCAFTCGCAMQCICMGQDIVDVASSLVHRSSLSARGGGYDPPRRNFGMSRLVSKLRSRIARRQGS